MSENDFILVLVFIAHADGGIRFAVRIERVYYLFRKRFFARAVIGGIVPYAARAVRAPDYAIIERSARRIFPLLDSAEVLDFAERSTAKRAVGYLHDAFGQDERFERAALFERARVDADHVLALVDFGNDYFFGVTRLDLFEDITGLVFIELEYKLYAVAHSFISPSEQCTVSISALFQYASLSSDSHCAIVPL